MKQAYIIIGRSGCGKGTQAELLINYLKNDLNRKVFDLQTGDKFRDFIKGEGYTNKLAKEIGDRGGLQPMFLVLSLWATALIENLKGDEDLILDGMPRKKDQADVLHSVFDFYSYDKPKVIYINVSREWAEEKLLARGRGDDEAEKIKNRQDWFDTDVIPVLGFYENHEDYEFLDINGDQSIEDVHNEIMNKIGDFEL
ncbi:MAG: nucleoside monophosphate kinase [Candidatus Pacebacteria bacterium]|nr:nucleoside monophosphate kinase [Candidatus Paceibacterota bacterium]